MGTAGEGEVGMDSFLWLGEASSSCIGLFFPYGEEDKSRSRSPWPHMLGLMVLDTSQISLASPFTPEMPGWF